MKNVTKLLVLLLALTQAVPAAVFARERPATSPNGNDGDYQSLNDNDGKLPRVEKQIMAELGCNGPASMPPASQPRPDLLAERIANLRGPEYNRVLVRLAVCYVEQADKRAQVEAILNGVYSRVAHTLAHQSIGSTITEDVSSHWKLYAGIIIGALVVRRGITSSLLARESEQFWSSWWRNFRPYGRVKAAPTAQTSPVAEAAQKKPIQLKVTERKVDTRDLNSPAFQEHIAKIEREGLRTTNLTSEQEARFRELVAERFRQAGGKKPTPDAQPQPTSAPSALNIKVTPRTPRERAIEELPGKIFVREAEVQRGRGLGPDSIFRIPLENNLFFAGVLAAGGTARVAYLMSHHKVDPRPVLVAAKIATLNSLHERVDNAAERAESLLEQSSKLSAQEIQTQSDEIQSTLQSASEELEALKNTNPHDSVIDDEVRDIFEHDSEAKKLLQSLTETPEAIATEILYTRGVLRILKGDH